MYLGYRISREMKNTTAKMPKAQNNNKKYKILNSNEPLLIKWEYNSSKLKVIGRNGWINQLNLVNTI